MSFNTQTFGSGTYNAGEFVFGSVVPGVVSRAGGTVLTVYGAFTVETAYNAFVAGIPCFSGVSGRGLTVYSEDGMTVSFVMPRMDISQIGSSVTVVVTEVGAGSVQGTIAVVEQSFYSVSLEMRRMFAPWVEVGPRRLDLAPQEK